MGGEGSHKYQPFRSCQSTPRPLKARRSMHRQGTQS
jgi:hypothetical protein